MKKASDPPTLSAAKAELAAMSGDLADSTQAQVVLELAARIDAGPDDRDLVPLARELRIALDALHARGADESEGGGLVARLRVAALDH